MRNMTNVHSDAGEGEQTLYDTPPKTAMAKVESDNSRSKKRFPS